MYIDTTTNAFPVTEQEIRALNPNVSFGTPFVPPPKYAYVFPTPVPKYNSATETVSKTAVKTSKGTYEEAYKVSSLPQDTIAANLKAATDALKVSIVSQVQARLDNFAKTRNYDSILSAATYATSNVPKFRAEGQFAVDLRDSTWSALYSILADVETGKRPVPTSISDIEQLLPSLIWPN